MNFVIASEPHHSGTRAYDPTKIAATAATITPLLLFLMSMAGFAMPILRVFWLGSFMPGVLAAVSAKYFPELRAWWHSFTVPIIHNMQEKDQRGHSWEADWVRAYGSPGASQRVRGPRNSRGPGRQGRGSTREAKEAPGDTSGFYRVLGVPPSASISEIQAAFRAAALKFHPDQAGSGLSDADKKRTDERFHRILEAYGTLRDPGKRRLYDSKG